MAEAAGVSWNELSRGVQDAFAWARAAEVEAVDVGTRGLLIGMLRSGEDPPNALLRHFGVSEDALFEALQEQAAAKLDPRASAHPALDDLPTLTTNAQGCVERAATFRQETKSASLDVPCLLTALIHTRGATARRAIARVIPDAPIAALAKTTLDWLHNQQRTYPELLEEAFPRRREPASTPDVLVDLQLSGSAKDAIGWATALVEARTGSSFDSVALLCGFILHAQPQTRPDTSVAVLNELRAQLATTDKRRIVALLTGHDAPPLSQPSGLPPPALQSDDLRSVIARATQLAQQVDGAANVRVRHLLAALFTSDASGGSAAVMSVLAREGVDDQRLRRVLNEAIRVSRPGDDLEFWDRLLTEPAPAAVPVTGARPPMGQFAGYDSDAVGSTDLLDITSDVETLASVLAAKTVVPPISVGLFGDWGSGKSFFMSALEGRIRKLERATKARDGASAYCRRIKHIRFNAWHYADANLWASLVTQIFDELAHSDGARAILTELDTATLARREAEARRDRARVLCEEIDQQLTDLEGNAGKLERLRQATLKERGDAPDEAAKLLETVELQAAPNNAMEASSIAAVAADLAGIGGAVRTVARLLGAGKMLMLLMVAAGIFALIEVVFEDAIGTIVAAAGSVTALAAALQRPVARARQAAQAAADAAQLIQDRARLVELELAAQSAERDRLTQQLIVAKKDVAAAEQDVKDIAEGRLLTRFVQERAAADDYRRHLGLVSLIRRDFDKLNTLMGEESDPPFDRIVLYIDDLDRCPPARVVEVLEAVHLLLALPLFVVVVAVDSRWLLRSLEIHYHALGQPAAAEADEYWVATPQNYLEKIFQIPYAVRPMASTGYHCLVDAMLATPAAPSVDGDTDVDADSDGDGDGENSTVPATLRSDSGATVGGRDHEEADAQAPPPVWGEPAIGEATEVEPPDDGPVNRAPSSAEPASDPAADEDDADLASLDLTPATLHVTEAELQSMKLLAPLIRTPRATKRLVNTYRLARASLAPEELDVFVGSEHRIGEHRAALVLLGVLIGFPTKAEDLFQELLDEPLVTQTWLKFVEEFGTRQSDRDQVVTALTRATFALAAPRSLKPYSTWAPRVGRYSFHTSRLVLRNEAAP